MSPEIRVFVPNWAKVPISTGSANAVLTTNGSMPAWSTNIYVGSGTLGINTAVAPATTFQVIDTSTAIPRGICHDQYNTGTNSAQINTRKARGTPTVPTTIVTGDILGRHLFWGHDGTAFIESANIRATSSGTIATNRVPSQLEFYTSTNAAPSVLTLGLTLNSAQQTLLTDGSAAAPSLSFSSDTDTGFFSAGANTIGVSVGTANILTLSNASGARLREPTNNSTLELLSAGGINLTANGTNQNITAAPSGTGKFKIGAFTSTAGAFIGADPVGTSYTNLWLGQASPLTTNFVISSDGNSTLFNGGAANGAIRFFVNGSEKSRFAVTTGNLLLGGLTTDGTGVLQFPAAVNSAGGIAFGTDIALYRSAATTLRVDQVGGVNPNLRLAESGTDSLAIQTNSGNAFIDTTSTGKSITLRSGNQVTALTLDSSQNATFAGNVTLTGTKTILFGATALGSIGVSADTTAGDLRINAPTSGNTYFGSGGSNFNTFIQGQNRILGWTGGGFQLGNGGATSASAINIVHQVGTGFTNTETSGTVVAFKIQPIYNQAAATTTNTDLLINRTQTSIGSGAQLLIDAQVAGVSKFKVDNTGFLTLVQGIKANSFQFNSQTTLINQADGVLTLFNNAQSDFNRLQFGGTTSSFPSLKRSTTYVQVRLADDSGDAKMTVGQVEASGTVYSSMAANNAPFQAQAAGATKVYIETDASPNGQVRLVNSSGSDGFIANGAGKITKYNTVTTAGQGVPSIYAAGRTTAQTAANSSISTYTVGSSDASFIISGNVLVTASTTHSFSLECAYTDEGNTARTVTFNVQQLGGTLVTSITNITGAGPYEGVPLHIRAKAGTSITIRTNSGGTYTSVTYNAEGVIQQIA